jgi:hypothetical protein
MTEIVNRGYHCDAGWHLRHSGLALAIYNKLGALTYERLTDSHANFFGSGERLGKFYGIHGNNVTDRLRWLASLGWLDVVRKARRQNESPIYRYIPHQEWERRHPGQCFEREVLVWDDEQHDELAQALYRASDGSTRWYAEMLQGLRSSGKPDGDLVLAWSDYLEQLPSLPRNHDDWHSTALSFVRAVKLQAQKVPCASLV